MEIHEFASTAFRAIHVAPAIVVVLLLVYEPATVRAAGAITSPLLLATVKLLVVEALLTIVF
jgi:hypothetical protein